MLKVKITCFFCVHNTAATRLEKGLFFAGLNMARKRQHLSAAARARRRQQRDRDRRCSEQQSEQADTTTPTASPAPTSLAEDVLASSRRNK